MEILYVKSKWEMWNDPLETFLQRAVSDGFDAVEIYLPSLNEGADEIHSMVSEYGLKLIAQINTTGKTVAEHLFTLDERFDFARQTSPILINSHTGSDAFTFAQNMEILARANQIASFEEIRITHETHRSRPLYSIPDTVRYLETMPDLWLNADLSHWTCVHEGLLERFESQLNSIFPRCGHLHARVGHPQGSQVPNPLSPEWKHTTMQFVSWWNRILDARSSAGDSLFTLTPEFGPPPYMPCEPDTMRPLNDAWEVNVRFVRFLREKLILPNV